MSAKIKRLCIGSTLIESLYPESNPQSSCQNWFGPGSGFTLLELLVVIMIIGILSSALVVSVQSSYRSARQTNCKSNLRQFGVALTIYRGEHDNNTPDWLSTLYPEYVDDRGLFVCTGDQNHGFGEPRPEALTSMIGKNEIDKDSGFWDNENNSSRPASSKAIAACSYLYEFSAAPVPSKWVIGAGFPENVKSPISSMGDYKHAQMRFGDNASKVNNEIMPYSTSRIPIVRCYHHFKDLKIMGYENESEKNSNTKSRNFITLNVAYAGNIFTGPLWWEGTIHPGDRRN